MKSFSQFIIEKKYFSNDNSGGYSSSPKSKEAIKRLKNKKKWDEFVKKDPFDGTVDFDPEDLAGGGIAGMLGEPTYQDEDHRIPLKGGGAFGEVIDHGWDEDNPDHYDLILK